eukprot:TRINITY_DN2475_c0_g1::TRINITY_DN2475_c0_g1_i1::g.8947::m.8947 TRINITY_DN2475_c0_g1::TRINITY_DN2475_c0_g1_i1::g.8947  ORF type:complete len:321 (+),score=32.87,sp/Q8L7N4/SP1_ARATH/45.65/5e-08,zf-C3HC4_3/PF13920.1/4.4e-12,Pex24p/PF06398.6/0.087,zf-C3HC4_2/PF13923.1/0.26,Period_C/PF12114.3/1,Cript/PF10235.4/23 TRINITY_DN2475_c0_g1_i1:238-1200(+)
MYIGMAAALIPAIALGGVVVQKLRGQKLSIQEIQFASDHAITPSRLREISVISSGGPHRAVDVVWENQRWEPVHGWKKSWLLNERPSFSGKNADFTKEVSTGIYTSSAGLPSPSWVWDIPWSIVVNLDDDDILEDADIFGMSTEASAASSSMSNSIIGRNSEGNTGASSAMPSSSEAVPVGVSNVQNENIIRGDNDTSSRATSNQNRENRSEKKNQKHSTLTDPCGWQYAMDWKRGEKEGFSAKSTLLSAVRRRKWVRVRSEVGPIKERTTECRICMDAQQDVVFQPCRHKCCCSNCAISLTICPVCRVPIEHTIKVYEC